MLAELIRKLKSAGVRAPNTALRDALGPRIEGSAQAPKPRDTRAPVERSGPRPRLTAAEPLRIPRELSDLLDLFKRRCLASNDARRWCSFLVEFYKKGKGTPPGAKPPPELGDLIAAVAQRMPVDRILLLERMLGVKLLKDVDYKEIAEEIKEKLLEAADLATRIAAHKLGGARVKPEELEKLRKSIRTASLLPVRIREHLVEELARETGRPRVVVAKKLEELRSKLSRPTVVSSGREVIDVLRELAPRKAVAPKKQGLRELAEKMREARIAMHAAKAAEAAEEKPVEQFRREKMRRLLEALRRKRGPFNTLG